jgi:hypothetical protein
MQCQQLDTREAAAQRFTVQTAITAKSGLEEMPIRNVACQDASLRLHFGRLGSGEDNLFQWVQGLGAREGHRAARSGTDQNPRASNPTQAFFNVGVGFLVNTWPRGSSYRDSRNCQFFVDWAVSRRYNRQVTQPIHATQMATAKAQVRRLGRTNRSFVGRQFRRPECHHEALQLA